MNKLLVLGCIVVLLMLSGPEVHAQISNGGFENGYPQDGDPFYIPLPDSVILPDWNYTSIDWVFNYWKAAEGTKSIDLNGSFAGQVAQSFTTEPNQRYKLHFSLSGNPIADANYPGVLNKTLKLSLTGLTDQFYSFDTAVIGNSVDDMKWQEKIVDFTGTGGQMTLAFVSTTTGASGPALDNVWIERISDVTVPEPSALGLLLCGLTGLLLARRSLRAS